MFQFTTTTVINSAKDSNGTSDKFTGNASAFNVTRVGTFKKDNIKSVYKRAYSAGALEQATLVVPAATAGRVIRLTVDVRLSQNVYSEYASTYLYFKKPIVVEVIASGTPSTDAAALVAQIKGLQNRFGESYITASANSATITLGGKNNYQRFYSAILEEEVASPNSLVQPEYNDLKATFTITSKGKVGFGDDAYMISSIMIPTQENTRFFGINSEERPILGANYSQYTLRYEVEKDTEDGIVGGGKSVTTHVFYVANAIVPAFEAALTATKSFDSLVVSVTDAALSLASDQTEQVNVSNAIGTVTYSSSAPSVATVNSSGVITAVAVGSAVITVTDGSGNTASVAITVAA